MIKWLRSISKRLIITLNVVAVICMLLAYLSTSVSPESVPALAFFGIAYSVVLLINLGFIVFWLLVKKPWALLSLLTILLGIGHFNAFVQVLPNLRGETDTHKSIKVYSQNVKLFSWYNWRKNIEERDVMIRNIQTVEADIYCFQEYFHHTGPGVFETSNLLKRKLDASNVHEEFTVSLYREQHYGIATFSKYPIINQGRINFDQERSNVCIYSDIVAFGDTIRVYNAHVASIRFSSDDYKFVDELQKNESKKPEFKEGIPIIRRLTSAFRKREAQVNAIRNHIEKSPYPVILCGDFNDTPVSYSYNTISEILVDSFRESGWGVGSTYIGKFPSFRIDYIFHAPRFTGYDYERLDEEISDHHGISTKLSWD